MRVSALNTPKLDRTSGLRMQTLGQRPSMGRWRSTRSAERVPASRNYSFAKRRLHKASAQECEALLEQLACANACACPFRAAARNVKGANFKFAPFEAYLGNRTCSVSYAEIRTAGFRHTPQSFQTLRRF